MDKTPLWKSRDTRVGRKQPLHPRDGDRLHRGAGAAALRPRGSPRRPARPQALGKEGANTPGCTPGPQHVGCFSGGPPGPPRTAFLLALVPQEKPDRRLCPPAEPGVVAQADRGTRRGTIFLIWNLTAGWAAPPGQGGPFTAPCPRLSAGPAQSPEARPVPGKLLSPAARPICRARMVALLSQRAWCSVLPNVAPKQEPCQPWSLWPQPDRGGDLQPCPLLNMASHPT